MRKFVLTFCLGCTLAMPATAAPTIEEIISQLQAQGYSDVSVSRTWLGRIRIEAESGTHEREIVFNQRTGEILRDYWEELEDEEDDENGDGEGEGDGDEPGETEEAEQGTEDAGDAEDDAAEDDAEDADTGSDEGDDGDDEDDEGDDDS